MPKLYETGTKHQVMVNAIYGAILSESELLHGYEDIYKPCEEDFYAIEKSKATIRDYKRLLKILREY